MENENQPKNQSEKKAKISFILGIVGMAAWLLPIIGAPIQVIGLTYGIKGFKSTKKKMAKIGIFLCIFGLVLSIINASIGAYMGVTGQHPIVNEILE